MELKKSPKANLQNKRGMFLEIGLAVSLLLVIGALAWGQSSKKVDKIESLNVAPEEEIIEITTQDQKPPEPVKQTIQVATDIINIVKNETEINTEFDWSEFSEDAVVIESAPVVEEAVAEEEIFMVVEDMPKFQGGDINTFRKWVFDHLKYPSIAQENGITGKVVTSFVVEKDGSLTNVEILASPDKSLSDEAARVLKMTPKWTPGKQRNSPVRVKYSLPIDFKLNQ